MNTLMEVWLLKELGSALIAVADNLEHRYPATEFQIPVNVEVEADLVDAVDTVAAATAAAAAVVAESPAKRGKRKSKVETAPSTITPAPASAVASIASKTNARDQLAHVLLRLVDHVSKIPNEKGEPQGKEIGLQYVRDLKAHFEVDDVRSASEAHVQEFYNYVLTLVPPQ